MKTLANMDPMERLAFDAGFNQTLEVLLLREGRNKSYTAVWSQWHIDAHGNLFIADVRTASSSTIMTWEELATQYEMELLDAESTTGAEKQLNLFKHFCTDVHVIAAGEWTRIKSTGRTESI